MTPKQHGRKYTFKNPSCSIVSHKNNTAGGRAFYGFAKVIVVCAFLIQTMCAPKEGSVCLHKKGTYLEPGCLSAGISSMALIYVSDFHGRLLHWSEEEFTPYLVYVDEDGIPHEDMKMFDAFLILAGARNTSGENHSFANQFETGYPSSLSDWTWLMKKIFAPDGPLAGLEKAAEKWHREVKIVLLIPYPEREQKKFGVLHGKELNFRSYTDRFTAVTWWISETLQKWENSDYSRLGFAGFYWMNEVMFEFGGVYGDNSDERLVAEIRDVIHSIDTGNGSLRFFWIPSNLFFVVKPSLLDPGAPWYLDAEGKEIFDAVIFQPNYMQGFYEWRTYRTLQQVAEVAKTYGFGVEMEFNECIFTDRGCLNRAMEYFDAGRKYQWRKSVQAFVFGNYRLSRMRKELPALYDEIYRYLNEE